MLLPEDDLINDYLAGKIIDPCDYDQYSLGKLDEFLGNSDDEV